MNTWHIVGVMMAAASLAIAEPAKVDGAKAQTTCPVMGGAVNHKIFTDYQGQRIYFCCKGCTADFNKDPAKFIKKLQEQGVVIEKAPAAGK